MPNRNIQSREKMSEGWMKKWLHIGSSLSHAVLTISINPNSCHRNIQGKGGPWKWKWRDETNHIRGQSKSKGDLVLDRWRYTTHSNMVCGKEQKIPFASDRERLSNEEEPAAFPHWEIDPRQGFLLRPGLEEKERARERKMDSRVLDPPTRSGWTSFACGSGIRDRFTWSTPSDGACTR